MVLDTVGVLIPSQLLNAVINNAELKNRTKILPMRNFPIIIVSLPPYLLIIARPRASMKSSSQTKTLEFKDLRAPTRVSGASRLGWYKV